MTVTASSLHIRETEHAVAVNERLSIRHRNTSRMMARADVDREVSLKHSYESIHRTRQVEIAILLVEAMGIERDDKARRLDWVMREFAGNPEDQVIMTCVATGYPDEDFIANHVVSGRSDTNDVASFVGFGDQWNAGAPQ
jgi:hypothetical protein